MKKSKGNKGTARQQFFAVKSQVDSGNFGFLLYPGLTELDEEFMPEDGEKVVIFEQVGTKTIRRPDPTFTLE